VVTMAKASIPSSLEQKDIFRIRELNPGFVGTDHLKMIESDKSSAQWTKAVGVSHVGRQRVRQLQMRSSLGCKSCSGPRPSSIDTIFLARGRDSLSTTVALR
jgi:hypothetical protein